MASRGLAALSLAVLLVAAMAGCQEPPDQVLVTGDNYTDRSGVLYVNVTEAFGGREEFDAVLATSLAANESTVLGTLDLPVGSYHVTAEFRGLSNASVVYTKQIGVDFLDRIDVRIANGTIDLVVHLTRGDTLPYTPTPTASPTETFTRPTQG